MIHPTAILDPQSRLGVGVKIGPYCVIGPEVELGDDCHLHNHVVIDGPTTIGRGNEFYPFAAIGHRSQDLKYAGEPTSLKIGNGNVFREFCTVHRSTQQGGATRIGDHGNFLAYSHIAHDCLIGDHVIFSNNGTVAGHVEVQDYAVLSGFSGVHQFCRIGRHAMTGGWSKATQDVPPFFIADGNPAEARGVNAVGLERRGFEQGTIQEIKKAYRILYRSNLNRSQAIEQLEHEFPGSAAVGELVDFIRNSKRGIVH